MAVMIGTWVSLMDTSVCEVLAQADFDFVLIDGEHGHAPVHKLHRVAGVFERAGRRICYRVAANRSELIKSALDQGATMVMVPMVDRVESALTAVEAAKYAPLGRRGIGPLRASGYYAEVDEYLAMANERTQLIVQIESQEAVDNVAAIAAVEGVDQLFVGPADLSSSMGIAVGSLTAEMMKNLETVATAARAAGKSVGIDCADPRLLPGYIDMGYSFFTIGSDLQYLGEGARAMARLAAESAGG